MPHNILSWHTLTFSRACHLGSGSTTVSSPIHKFRWQSPGHPRYDTYPDQLRTFRFELSSHDITRSTKELTINETRRQQSSSLPFTTNSVCRSESCLSTNFELRLVCLTR